MERFKEAITFIFKEKGWENKILPIYAGLVIATLVGAVVSLFFTLPISILSEAVKDTNTNVSGLESISSFTNSLSSWLTFPVLLYIYGYLIDVFKKKIKGAKEVLVENKVIFERMVKGIKLYISIFIATLPTTLVGTVLLVLSVIGFFMNYSSTESSKIFMPAGIVLGLLTFLLIVALAILNSIITYATLYIYYKTGSFRESFNYGRIITIIKGNERALLNTFFDIFILGVIQMFFVVFFFIPLLCVSPFVYPMVTLVTLFAKMHLIADRFKEIDNIKE